VLIFVFRFITGSYDRTCKIWDTHTGEELFTLEGHKNVVYSLSFNNPFGDRVATGSFDKTAKVTHHILFSNSNFKLFFNIKILKIDMGC
jgi:WD40 repeat protein